MSYQEGLVTYIFIALIFAAFIVYISYKKFKWGIPTRIFSMVCAVAIVTGTGGRVAGSIGDGFTWWHRAAILSILIPILGLISYGLYKMVISGIQSQVDRLVESSRQISSAVSNVATTAAEQSAIVEQVSAAVAAINQTSNVASGVAYNVLEMSTQTAEQGRAGQQCIDEAAQIMGLVSDIAGIVDTVGDLAEQSNILAMNAGIEAAKAGDQGRGFSVVAMEIRNLATQSKTAAKEIRTTIERVQEGKQAIDESSAIIKKLAEVLDQSADAARRISTATSGQAAEIQQITLSMSSVAEGGQNANAAAQSLQTALESLEDIASALHRQATGHELNISPS